MSLEELLSGLRRHPGLTRKAVVGPWASRFFSPGERGIATGIGADAGAVPVPGGYLLVSAEGMYPGLLRDPEFAGLCSVTAAVNDIYAAGGRPLGLVTVVFAGGITDAERGLFLDGLEKGLAHYGIPLLGGHTNPEAGQPTLAIASVGFATDLLGGGETRPGDTLLFATDLEGEAHGEFFAWDTVTGREPERIRAMLEVLPRLAEGGLRAACRDVSNPGILGTLAMMLEPYGLGASVDLDAVPVPPGTRLDWWLATHTSFGFLIAVPGAWATRVTRMFESAGATCVCLGEIARDSLITVRWRGETAVFLDIEGWPVTGLGL
jgi:selenophosphate synthetase-related protein